MNKTDGIQVQDNSYFRFYKGRKCLPIAVLCCEAQDKHLPILKKTIKIRRVILTECKKINTTKSNESLRTNKYG